MIYSNVENQGQPSLIWNHHYKYRKKETFPFPDPPNGPPPYGPGHPGYYPPPPGSYAYMPTPVMMAMPGYPQQPPQPPQPAENPTYITNYYYQPPQQQPQQPYPSEQVQVVNNSAPAFISGKNTIPSSCPISWYDTESTALREVFFPKDFILCLQESTDFLFLCRSSNARR